MSYSINWTIEAQETFDQNIVYLEQEWNNKVLNKFLDRVNNVLQKIKINPFLYPLDELSESARKCVINKRIVLYYRVFNDSTIDLVTFWNTYQNPDNLKL